MTQLDQARRYYVAALQAAQESACQRGRRSLGFTKAWKVFIEADHAYREKEEQLDVVDGTLRVWVGVPFRCLNAPKVNITNHNA